MSDFDLVMSCTGLITWCIIAVLIIVWAVNKILSHFVSKKQALNLLKEKTSQHGLDIDSLCGRMGGKWDTQTGINADITRRLKSLDNMVTEQGRILALQASRLNDNVTNISDLTLRADAHSRDINRLDRKKKK